MFKSLFKKNRGPAEQEDAPQQSTEESENPTKPREDVVKRFLESVKPSSPEEYVVPVVEVERLWSRFQQLGPDESGSLSDNLFRLHPHTTDPFVRQIWKTFPRKENDNVSFHSFVGIFMWWKTATLDQKLRGIFKILNKSQPLDVPALQQIIMKLEKTTDEEAAKSKAELLVQRLDDKEQGFIDEDQWLNWISQLPEHEISKLTKFVIIPPEMAEYPNSWATSAVPPENQAFITNEALVNIAGKIGETNWTPLAHQLGFSEREIRNIKKKYPHRSREQVYQMLLLWRQQMPREATISAVELALRNCGMEDIAALLYQ